jgi:hypothetical protein
MSSDLSRVYVAECGARCELTAANYSARSESGGQPYTDMTTASATTAGGSPAENFTSEVTSRARQGALRSRLRSAGSRPLYSDYHSRRQSLQPNCHVANVQYSAK